MTKGEKNLEIQGDMDLLQNTAIHLLTQALAGKAVYDRHKVDLAMRALSAVSRLRATERVKDANQLMVLRHIAKDRAEFHNYVKISLPHLNPAKQLSG